VNNRYFHSSLGDSWVA